MASSAITTDSSPAPHPSLLPTAAFEARFPRQLHCDFILALDRFKNTFEYVATEHLRMSAVYWALMAMDLCDRLVLMDRPAIIDFVRSCQCASGGYSGNVGHDAHILYTLSAVQILIILDAIDEIDRDRVAAFVVALQRDDGSFAGDEWGEVDTRFSYCALNCLSLIGRLDRMNVTSCTEYVLRCRNFDGGFGAVPGAESHAGQIFVCVAALAIADQLHRLDADALGWWLSERQLPVGGLNGRPEKKPDVCYSWWVLSALVITDRIDWIDRRGLAEFILACQDAESGGFSDRPGNMADPFHTFFGLGALSLLGYTQVAPIDAVYAMPTRCMQTLHIEKSAKRTV